MHFKKICILFLLLLGARPVVSGVEAGFRPITPSMGLPGSQVNCIMQDSRGYVWLGTSSGLSRFDGYRFFNYFSHADNEHTLLNNFVKSIREDKHGNIWVRTQDGYCVLDPKTGLFNRHPDAKTAQRLTAADRHTRLTDAEGNTWDLTRTSCRVYSATHKQWFDSVSKFLSAKGFDAGTQPLLVRDLKQDRRKRVWIATDHSGLLMIDWQQHRLNHYESLDGNYGQLPENTIQCLFIDKNDALWMGTYRNGAAYYWDSYERFRLVGLGDVCALAEDRLGNFWCGTNDRGLVCYNPVTGEQQRYDASRTGMGSDVVVSALCATDGSLWFGGFHGGLARYANGQWTVFRAGSSPLKSDNIWTLAEDTGGRIVIGTLDAGLQVFNPKTGEWKQFCMANSDLPSDYVASVAVDEDNRYVVGHMQHFSIIDPQTGHVWNYATTKDGQHFVNPTVNQVAVDSRGLIWLATLSGVSIYNPATDRLQQLTTENGLANNLACLVIEDATHRMWVGTGSGLSCVTAIPSAGDYHFGILNYGELDGVQQRQLNFRAAMVAHDGSIVVGGQQGINIEPNNDIVSAISSADVLFSGLKLSDHVVSPGERFNGRVVLQTDLNSLSRLDLHHGENRIQIQLASSNVVFPPHKMFVYRVEGLASEWLRVNSYRPHIGLANLSPGKYRLQVQVLNFAGRPISDVRELLIVVHPPFWLSWWAMLCYAALAVAAVWLLLRLYARRQKLRFQTEQQQREIAKDRQLDQLKLRFFTNVSHELRTPLTLVISPLAKMMNDEEDPQKRQRLAFVHRNATNLLGLVNQLLDFRKVYSADEQLNLATGDIVSFIDNICKSFRLLQDKDIVLGYHPQPASLFMAFDADKLGKVMNNLLSNAFKFTPEGGHVDVWLRQMDQPDGGQPAVELSVADTGIGISDADKKHVFDRFFQVPNRVGQPYGGSGIGLNLAKDFVLLHGGTISVADNEGGGSLFRVVLPVRKADKTAAPLAAASQPAAGAETPAPAPRQRGTDAATHRYEVLIVDDNQDFLGFMADVLRDSYDVRSATNGQEALDMVARHQPDAILSDVMMPVMDGIELCRRIKSDHATERIPFILLTARMSQNYRMEGLENGADDYITKPFDLDMLNLRIANLIKWRGDKKAPRVQPHVAQVEVTPLDRQFVEAATAFVEQHLASEELSVESLSETLNVSRVHLYKKMLSLTGNTPSEFIRTIRLQHGEQLLRQSQLSVAEIAYRVGFNNPRYFTKYFKEMYGVMPSQYKDKHSSPASRKSLS